MLKAPVLKAPVLKAPMLKPLSVLALAAALAVPSLAHAKPAGKFLSDAIKGDTSEMTLGAIGARRGQSAGVRAFGATLHADHAKGYAQAVAAARRDGVAVPGGMMPEAAREQRKLAHLSGAAFDREFARYMVEDHRKDIAEFAEQVRTGDRVTARLAQATLPVLRKHLRMAEALR